MDTTQKYLQRIINETLTHTEVIAIGHGLINWLSNDNELLLLAKVLTKYGINHHMRKTIAKLMIKIIKEREERKKAWKLENPNEIDF